jgi:hypothetical protein
MILRNGKFSGKKLRTIFWKWKFSMENFPPHITSWYPRMYTVCLSYNVFCLFLSDNLSCLFLLVYTTIWEITGPGLCVQSLQLWPFPCESGHNNVYNVIKQGCCFGHCPPFLLFVKQPTSRKLDLFPSSGKGGKEALLLLRVPHGGEDSYVWRAGTPFLSFPDDGNKSSFRNVVIFLTNNKDGRQCPKQHSSSLQHTIVS